MYQSPLFLLIWVLLVSSLGSAACASVPATRDAGREALAGCSASDATAPVRRGALPSNAEIFESVDEAVLAAFSAAGCSEGPGLRGRLRFGTIRQVAGGYVWTPPRSSDAGITSAAPFRVALRLDASDVAIYGIHPRSGRPELDRANESLHRSERALTRARDGRRRALYVLTPSRRIVSHALEASPIQPIAQHRLRSVGASAAPHP